MTNQPSVTIIFNRASWTPEKILYHALTDRETTQLQRVISRTLKVKARGLWSSLKSVPPRFRLRWLEKKIGKDFDRDLSLCIDAALAALEKSQ